MKYSFRYSILPTTDRTVRFHTDYSGERTLEDFSDITFLAEWKMQKCSHRQAHPIHRNDIPNKQLFWIKLNHPIISKFENY